LGTTAIVLAMIEDEALGDEWLLANPVAAIRHVSHDPSLQATVMLRDGRRVTALEVQWGLYERAKKYEQSHGLEAVDTAVGADVLARWEAVLTGLEHDPLSVADRVDWVAKRRLVDGYTERHDVRPGDARLKAIDLQYHDLRPGKGLAERAGLTRMVDPADAKAAMTQPPTTTRAYFRGRCLQKFPAQIVAANWDSMVFDVGRDPLRRVPMMEPLRGTAEHVRTLIDESDTVNELLERLGA
jgi:proteasome accessory factor A